jgi:hypothetical protein
MALLAGRIEASHSRRGCYTTRSGSFKALKRRKFARYWAFTAGNL